MQGFGYLLQPQWCCLLQFTPRESTKADKPSFCCPSDMLKNQIFFTFIVVLEAPIQDTFK
jgi:hypothetical protein